MDSSDLSYFAVVAQEGTFTKAAKRLRCVQSNVTARIRSLEEELRVSLFHRNGRGVTLTRAGQILLPYAYKVAALLAEAKAIGQDSRVPNGSLSMGAMETTAAFRLPPILAAYHQAYPEVDLSLVTRPTACLIGDVLSYRLDGAFVTGPVNHPDLVEEPIFKEEMVAIFDYSQCWPQVLHDKNRIPTILVSSVGCSYRKNIEKLLNYEGISHFRLLELGTMEGILKGVAAGIGISVLPKIVIIHSPYEGAIKAHALVGQHAMVPTVFIRRRDTFVSNALTRFLEFTREGIL